MKSTSMAIVAALTAVAAQAQETQPQVEKCEREMGTLAVAEPQDHVLASLSRYKLGSPALVLRLLAQESGCFVVVERGAAMQNLQQERALASGGQLQQGSNIGGGQLQAADFVLTPAVQFSEDTGGVGATVGGLLGRGGGLLGQLGGLVGGVKFKEAETTIVVADVRSGIQVASAEGKASKMNFSLGGWGWGGLGWAAGGGYSKTPEGKLIAASLLDNFNKVVQQIRSKPTLVRSTSEASRQNAAQSIQATGATAPVATIAPVPVPRAGVALPAALVGAFSGQYGGAERGVFSVMIDASGRISGVGQSATGSSFSIAGMANSNGTVAMQSNGQAGAAQFNGMVNTQTGALVGTWRMNDGNGQGTFSGSRQ